MTPKTTPRDFFLHLGAIIALYISAGALISLAFDIINHAFPDALGNYFSPSSVAWPISILIILVPLTYILEWLINRDIVRMPEKRDIWVRRWRIYLTLFLAVVLIAGDLIALINTYLNGEITSRFGWKVGAILLIAGTIGKYYFYTMYEKWKHAKLYARICAWFGAILVVAVIVGGFLIVGSPATARALRFDEQRVNNLQSIQSEIVYTYWSQKGKLPQKLSDLNDSISGFEVPTDPETGATYEYSVTSSSSNAGVSFELCATFDRASENSNSYPGSASWNHSAGRACFDRAVDPSLHPVNKNAPVTPVQPM